MLKNLDPLLSPALLAILREMGHGDEIAIVDANFPAAANARRIVRLDGVSATTALQAILSVMPLDDFGPECAWRMEVVGDPDADLPVYREFRALLSRESAGEATLSALERHAFYARARDAFAIVATSETRLYGNILLRKGVVRPRDEASGKPVLVDAHQHYWSLARGDYGWLTPALGPIHRDFGPHDLAPIVDRHGITHTVLVQAAPTVAETEYLLAIADCTASVAAVTGWIDMRGDPATLARLARHPKMRAIRPMLQDVPDANWILDPACRPMLTAIAQHGLLFEFLGKPGHLDAARRLLDEHPALTVVIDHGMKPDIASGAFDDWATRIAEIAARPNALCKLSGLITEAGPGWSISRVERYVRHVVDTFGPDRVMWGSDWPVVDLAGGYDAWRAATLALLDSRSEAPAILGATAARVYRIGAVRHASAP